MHPYPYKAPSHIPNRPNARKKAESEKDAPRRTSRRKRPLAKLSLYQILIPDIRHFHIRKQLLRQNSLVSLGHSLGLDQIVVLLNHYGKGLFKLASILIGLVCGYIVALCFGMVDFSALSTAGWFQVPMPLAFGIKFDISAILPLAILFLVNSIQAMGDFSATTTGGMDRLPTDDELNGGIIGYGVSNIVGALFGCPPTATYSQNVGIVGSTRVVARKVFTASAVILLIAGLIPKFSALLRTIPQCVLGGAVASVFASIAMTGIKLLVTEKLTYRNTTVAGLSIAIGMGVSLSDGCLNQMTASIHDALNMSMSLESFQSIINNTFASSPVVLATIFAVILNLILPKDKPDAQ